MCRRLQAVPVVLATLLFVSIFPPFSPNLEPTQTDEIGFSSSLSDGDGRDLIGTTLDIEGMDWEVGSEIGLDYWQRTLVQNGSTIDGLDLTISEDENTHLCWTSIANGTTNYAMITPNGSLKTQVVDAMIPSENRSGECSISLNPFERVQMMYWHGDDLRMARDVLSASETYTYWRNRTIIEDVSGDSIELDTTSDSREIAVFRDGDMRLRKVEYNSAYWVEELLDEGPIGREIEMGLASDDTIRLLYFHPDSNEIRLMRGNGTSIDLRVIANDVSIIGNLAMDLAENDLEQLAYSIESGGNVDVEYAWSIADQDTGRINPDPSWYLSSSSQNSQILDIEVFDVDGDGDLEILIVDEDGVNIHQNKSGPAAMSINGTAVEKGDFDGDGILDLAIAEYSWNTNSGQVRVYQSNESGLILDEEWAIFNGTSGSQLGITLTAIGDVDNDGDDELAMLDLAAIGVSQDEIVRIAYGDSSSDSFVIQDSIAATGNGPYFGRSIIGGGDLNGDGKADMVVSNTGTLSSPTGYSSFEVFLGSTNGLQTNPDSVHQSTLTGRLFAASIAFAGDVDGDGDDELLVGELLNNSQVDQGGKVWYFAGSNSGLSHVPNETIFGSHVNDRIGFSLSSAGDVNEDGWDDFLIMSDLADSSGSVELYLGSENGPLLSTSENIIEGNSGDKAGRLMLAGFDAENDGLNELMFTVNDNVVIHSERDWVASSYTVDSNLNDFSLKTPAHGSPVMMAIGSNLTIREWTDEGSPGGLWQDRIVPGSNISSHDITHSGRSIYATAEGNSLYLRQAKGHVFLKNEILSTSGFADELATTIDQDGIQHSVFTQSSMSKLWYSVESANSWQNEVAIDGIGTIDDLEIHTGSKISIVYLDKSAEKVVLSTNGSSWLVEDLLDGQAIGSTMASAMDGDDLLLLMDSNVSGSEALTLVRWNGTNLTSQIIDSITGSESLDLTVDHGVIHLSARLGDLVRITSISGDHWVNQTISIDRPEQNDLQFALPWLSVPGLNGTGLMMKWNGSGWEEKATQPVLSDDGLLRLISQHSPVLLYTNIDSKFMFSTLNDGGQWFHSPLEIIPDTIAVSSAQSRAVIREANSANVVSVRFAADFDRDMVPNEIDDLPLIGNQWLDSDLDGFGDNPSGPFSDDCIDSSGTSRWGLVGCSDFDSDNFADTIDNCISNKGNSWFDRIGCYDYDKDGWSTNDGAWRNGDLFPNTWKQSLDTDGDGYGDNHGPDCCGSDAGDLFPYNRHQWADTDGDGFGDNRTHFESGDQCPFEAGKSWRDRNGCLDSDGDGSSDPSDIGTFAEWGFADGADRWKNDPTQWNDTDGDGFGDNSSDLATNPDKFPNNSAAANDTDNDGYPDDWTALYNGSNAKGLELDYCPEIAGNSITPYKGCLDSDGDGWADLGDAFPFEVTQQEDTDGDGFGDNSFGFEGDQCKEVFGYANGTDGVGCPNELDSDSDGILDDFDDCANTPPSESVNSTGCGESQIDDDGDSVMNDADKCPNSPSGESVDPNGCTDVQNQVDSDGDGVNDPLDECENTEQGAEVDAYGCSEQQADDDGDGVPNSIDDCPDSQQDALVDEFGCVDEEADSDQDGYTDGYTYELNNDTNLRENQSGDAFPNDSTQWSDLDGDGYGDNITGNEADKCPEEPGTSSSSMTRGCPDSDGDGVVDLNDPFPSEPTQWEDEDGDGVGDNPEGENPDQCLGTKEGHPVNEQGCSTLITDSDGDGVMDIADKCPNEGERDTVDVTGCEIESSSKDSDSSEELFGFSTGELFGYGLGGLLALLLILVILVRLFRSDDWDLDDDDDEDDWYEEEVKSFGFSSSSSSPYASSQANYGEIGGYGTQTSPLPSRESTNDAYPITRGPSGGPPDSSPMSAGPPQSRGPPGRSPMSAGPPQSRGPPGRSPVSAGPPQSRGPPGGPSRGPPGGPSRGPIERGGGDFTLAHQPVQPNVQRRQPMQTGGGGFSLGHQPVQSNIQARQPQQTQIQSATDSQHQVVRTRRVAAAPTVDHGLFTQAQQSAKDAAVAWTKSALAAGSDERTILMQLQETGWGAQQSRAIITLSMV